ncbi:peptide-methionine (S)-S-oxide reductase [Paenibacillus sp. R14(2021)]|uniref:peptide-methionine (S)-S-oxide reductase n=1 Tax=Paenibacillus sp. R14(2021) TaxID=2859228 RepID=UPI0035BE9FF1
MYTQVIRADTQKIRLITKSFLTLRVISNQRFDKPIATKIAAVTTFYKAEDEHQNYYKKVRFSSFLNKLGR